MGFPSKDPEPTTPSLDLIREAFTPILRQAGAEKAIVFGSYARGEADRYIDLDLIIVSETDRGFFDRRRDFRSIHSQWNKGFALLIYTPAEISEMLARHNPFIQRALEEGVVTYEK